ncbi:hypothetical protein CPB84DRAFT_1773834 [Gymnopilus junonius]|uniref:Uncharacterized protein n=1 Tax=Gymnopilus junonius TaxID=109634 RepID=A0A9P5NRA9_GYMJU|nr:hypothetical protein CPB84DRAFT_1773834 [Gymnopilus junonius]
MCTGDQIGIWCCKKRITITLDCCQTTTSSASLASLDRAAEAYNTVVNNVRDGPPGNAYAPQASLIVQSALCRLISLLISTMGAPNSMARCPMNNTFCYIPSMHGFSKAALQISPPGLLVLIEVGPAQAQIPTPRGF